jgi:hypothetical protein
MRALMTVGLLIGAAVGGIAQAPQPGANPETWKPARTPHGQPDFQGVWHRLGAGVREQGVTYPPVNVNDDIPYPQLFQQSNTGDVQNVVKAPSLPTGIVDPPDQKLPWRPEAAAKRQRIMDRIQDPTNFENLDPSIYCMPTGVPRSGPGLYQFLQTQDKVVLVYEYMHIYRIIPLDKRPHVSPNIRLFMGNPRGHWEDDTLVVETTNFTGKNWHDLVGTYTSDGHRTIERFRLVNPDTIEYRVTVDDPKLFTKPWTVAGSFVRAAKGNELMENSCVEGTFIGKQVENSLHAVRDKIKVKP